MATYRELRQMIIAEAWEDIEGARGAQIKPHIPDLIALYDDLESWPKKLAVIQLLQDQEDTDEVRRVMLDCLRAPNTHDWSQDNVELTKAAALGFVDEEYDTFMAFYNDRERLAETVAKVLAENDMTQVPMGPKPEPKPVPKASNLMEAIANGDAESVKAFIAAGDDLDAPGSHRQIQGMQPLIFAISNKQLEIVDILLDAGADPNVVREGGQTPLSWAVFLGLTDLAIKLMDLGGDLERADQYGETLAMPAAKYGYDEILDELIKRGAPFNKPYRDGRTPLWFAAENGKTNAVMRLIEEGLDINELISGSAPLHLAVRNNSSRLMTALLKAGAEIDLLNGNGRTALMIAASNGYVNLVKKLVKAGADTTLKDRNGQTAATMATGRRADEIKAELG